MVRERGERPQVQAPPVMDVVPPRPQYEAPINWWALDDTERLETMMVLMPWVQELVRRYALPETTIPPCWWKHEPLIQELLAIYQYRDQQQFTRDSPPGGPHEFHYQFQLDLGRLRYWTQLTECNQREHNPPTIPAWAAKDASEHLAEAYVALESALTSKTEHKLWSHVDPE